MLLDISNLYILNEIYTNNFYIAFLKIISILSVLCGISVIVTKNPIVSVLFLIGLFFSVASYLILVGLTFIGLSYLLVYVGAVSILFLFILMLINVRISELVTDNNNSAILASLIGLFIITTISSKGNEFDSISSPSLLKDKEIGIKILDIADENPYIENEGMKYQINDFYEAGIVDDLIQSLTKFFDNLNHIFYVTSKMWDGALGETSHITSIGSIIYTSYPIWLILTSIILLLAMVGAIVITIKQ